MRYGLTRKSWPLKCLFIIQFFVVLALFVASWTGRKDYATVKRLSQAGAELRTAGSFWFGKYGDVEIDLVDSESNQPARVSADEITGVFVLTEDWDKDQVLSDLIHLPSLELVYLEHRHLNEDDFEQLARLNSVRMFELSGTGITRDGLLKLASCQSLEFVIVGDTSVSEDAITEFNRRRPNVWISKR